MPYLLALSIGPVQEFIASARRSRDLWFGSWLLSEISKAAAQRLARECGTENLIFPAIDGEADLVPVVYQSGGRTQGTDFNVVNKIVAFVDGNRPTADIGGEIKDAMNERLEETRLTASRKLSPNLFDEGTAQTQVADLLEYYWAAYPLANPQDENEYRQARDEVEALLAARKNLHDFAAVSWGSDRPKSSLDGLRESVIRKEAYKQLSKAALRNQFGVREGEQLCGVGLLKRLGNRQGDGSFFSTSHVAALPLIEQLKDRQAVNHYICQLAELLGVIGDGEGTTLSELPRDNVNELRKVFGFVPVRASKKEHEAFGRWDGHLLFEERLREFFEDNQEGKRKLEKARIALKSFLNEALGGK